MTDGLILKCLDCRQETSFKVTSPQRNEASNIEYLNINLFVRKQDLAELLTLILLLLIWVTLMVRSCRKTPVRTQQINQAKRLLEVGFTIVNLLWISACFCLVYQSIYFAINKNARDLDIVSLYPWYLAAILSCCAIDMTEEFLFSAVERNGTELNLRKLYSNIRSFSSYREKGKESIILQV